MTPTLSAEEMERERFEAWVRIEWPSAPFHYVRDALPKNDLRYGEYCDEYLQRAWVGWQACAAARHPQPECGEADTGLNFAAWLITQSDFKLTADRVDAAQSAWDYLLPVIAQMDANHSVLQHEADEDKRLLAERDARIDSLMETFTKAANYLGIDTEQARKAPGKPSDVFIAHIYQLRARVAELSEALKFARGFTDSPLVVNRIDAALSQPSGGKEE